MREVHNYGYERKVVDELTEYSVSVATDKYIEEDGEMLPVGERSRRAYTNNKFGRKALKESEPEDIVNAVLARWGDSTKIPEPFYCLSANIHQKHIRNANVIVLLLKMPL